MPRFVLEKPPKSAGHEKLVKRLVQELKSPSNDPQPLILEHVIEATGSRHVNVIWDEWRHIPDEVRAKVIDEAYHQAEGAKKAARITLSSGVTPDEALVLGLLPYKLYAIRRVREAESAAEFKKAWEGEAGTTVQGSKADELRYARLEDAEAAKRRLQKALPSSDWVVVEEVPISG